MNENEPIIKITEAQAAESKRVSMQRRKKWALKILNMIKWREEGDDEMKQKSKRIAVQFSLRQPPTFPNDSQRNTKTRREARLENDKKFLAHNSLQRVRRISQLRVYILKLFFLNWIRILQYIASSWSWTLFAVTHRQQQYARGDRIAFIYSRLPTANQ